MLRTPGAAAYCGCSKSKLEKARVSGDGPVYIKIGRAVVYDVADLDEWLASNRRTSTSDNGTLPVLGGRRDNPPLRPRKAVTERDSP